MPQTDFIATPEDEERIVRHALGLGIRITPNLRYKSRNLISINEWGAFSRIRRDTSLFFLFSDSTCSSPFQTGELEERGQYYIQQRYGGPYIMLLSHLPYEEFGAVMLPGGSISYYSTYYNSVTGDLVRPSPDFKKLYRSIDAEIKRSAKCSKASCIDGRTRDYWLTPKAQIAVEAGARPAVDGLEL